MDPLLSPAQYAMISSFLEVAIGQTTITAHVFLEDAQWIVDDALELFYMGSDTRPFHRPRQIPSGQLCGDGLHTTYDVPLSYGVQSGPPPLQSNKRRHTNAKLPEFIPLPPPTDRRQKRTRTEMTASSSIRANSSAPSSSAARPPPNTIDIEQQVPLDNAPLLTRKLAARKRRRTRAEIAAATAAHVPSDPPQLITYNRRRTNSEINASLESTTLAAHSGTSNITSTPAERHPTNPPELIVYQRRRTHSDVPTINTSMLGTTSTNSHALSGRQLSAGAKDTY